MRRSALRKRANLPAALLLFVFVTATGAAQDDSRFGGLERPLPTPVIVDGREIGTASVFPPAGETGARIESDDLSTLIAPLVNDEARDALAGLARDSEYVGDDELRALGVTIDFDTRRLVLHIRIAGRLRPVRAVSVRGGGPAGRPLDDALLPARFSAYLNAAVSAQLLAGGVLEETRLPISLTIEPVLQYEGYVLEQLYSVSYDSDWSAAPSYVRLVKDLPTHAVRLSVGDTLYHAAGFQARPPLQGIAVDRHFDVSPFKMVAPSVDRSLVLDYPSTVRVLVNGSETLRSLFPAGTYELQDFALATGLNEVVIEVTEPDGSIERIAFDKTFDSALLAPGTHEFSYAFGVPPFTLQVPRFSGFHRIGLSDILTVGANAQTDFSVLTLGAGALWASRIGIVGLDFAASVGSRPAGAAASLRYQFRRLGIGPTPSVVLAIAYTGSEFRTLAGAASRSDLLTARVTVSHRFFSHLAASVAATATADTFAGTVAPGFSVAMNGSPSVGTTVSFSFDMDFPADEPVVWEAQLRLSSVGLDRRGSVGFNQDLKRGIGTVQYQLPAARATRAVSVSAGYSGVPTDPTRPSSVSGTTKLVGRRFTGDFAARVNATPGAGPQIVSSLQLAGALAVAGRSIALSRPITGAFAVVDRNQKYRDFNVGVNPGRSGYAAVADRLGPAVLPGLAAYTPSRLSVESGALPLGFDLGPSSYLLRPGYKTGHRITVGTDATVYVVGRLVAGQGVPIALQSGLLVHAEDDSEHRFFTNRDGRFAVYGLETGRYELRIADGRRSRIEIPAEAVGAYELGDVGGLE